MTPIKGKNLNTNYYDILETSMGADEDELRRAYDRIKSIYSEDSMAIYGLYSADEIKEFRTHLEQAFRVLIDPENRREYDKTLISEPLHKNKQRVLTISTKQKEEKSKDIKDIDKEKVSKDEEVDSKEKSESSKSAEKVEQDNKATKSFDPQKPNIEIPDDAEFSGEYLKELREEYGINLRLVSDTTKVSMTNLRLLEAEEWSKLPAIVYVKGFITQYARFIGLDPKRILKDLISRYESSKDYTAN